MDGEHNDEDEEAINRAITALSPDGAVLYFDGIYKLPENTNVTTKTYFNIQTSGVTLVFSSRTKFLVKSNSAIAIVFALSGVSYFKTIGTLSVESDATIIKPTFVSGAGRWLALNKHSFSVAQFGAYGDGVHDVVS